jgi:hypothetical protein
MAGYLALKMAGERVRKKADNLVGWLEKRTGLQLEILTAVR